MSADAEVRLTFLGHATVLLELAGVRVLTDPVLGSRLLFLRRITATPPLSAYQNVDVAIVSHLHHDHCDLPSLRQLGPGATVIVPVGGAALLRRHGFRKVVALSAGETHTAGAVTVTATPAVHDGRRRPFGPSAAAVGYLISSGTFAAYFAGDTDLFDGMRDLPANLDLALVPVWGWGPNLGPGHLDPGRAAEAVARLQPRRVVPVHWGTLFPYGLAPFYRDRLSRPAHDFADAVAARGLQTDVHVITPVGELAWRP